MRFESSRRCFISLSFLVIALLALSPHAPAKDPKEILVLNSYHQGYAWSDGIMEGLESVLGQDETSYNLLYEYMDTKHVSGENYLEELYRLYLMKYQNREFDLIIASDESAFQFLLKHHREIFHRTPVVFCGVHGFQDDMIEGREDLFTGVVEAHDVKKTLDLALSIHRKTKTVYVIHDRTEMGLSMRKQLNEVLRDNSYPLEFAFRVDVDMEKIQEEVQNLPEDHLIYYLIFLKDASGNFFSPEESVFRISSVSTVPVYGLGDFLLGHGIVGGMVNSGFYQGETAARIARRILEGEKVKNVPVVKESPNRYMFDFKQMKRFGIRFSNLPRESIVINKPSSFYHEYKRLVWSTFGVFLSLGVIIVILLINIKRRRHTEEELRREHELISRIISNIPHAVFWKDGNSDYLGCNENFAVAVGMNSPSDVIGKSDFDLGWDRGDAEFFRRCDQEVMSAGIPLLNMENTIKGTEGKDVILLTSKVPLRNAAGNVIGVLGIFSDITQRKLEEEAKARLAIVVEQAAEMIAITDTDGVIEYTNPAFERVTGYSREEAVGQNLCTLLGGNQDKDFHRKIWETLWSGQVWTGRCTNQKKDGSFYEEEVTISPVRDSSGIMISYVSVGRDVSQEVLLEMQLRQAQKLEAIGQLAAGIAHEINTPTQYVGDNIRFLKDSFADLTSILREHEKVLAELKTTNQLPDLVKKVEEAVEGADLEYLLEEVPQAVKQSIEGVERVAKIVRAMKEFSHPGSEEKTPLDLNKAIESTITVARNEWKYVADMNMDFDPSLPLVPCLPGEFNQVILNMVVNSAHAIEGVLGDNPQKKGTITISTRRDGNHAEIRISDTGGGIPEEIKSRIFEPFFTTKEVGKGTGQGLAISHNVIVEKHGGTITLETEEGEGSTFIIRLPITEEEDSEPA